MDRACSVRPVRSGIYSFSSNLTTIIHHTNIYGDMIHLKTTNQSRRDNRRYQAHPRPGAAPGVVYATASNMSCPLSSHFENTPFSHCLFLAIMCSKHDVVHKTGST